MDKDEKSPFNKRIGAFLSRALSWIAEKNWGWPELLALGLYAALIAFGGWHHEPWGDESVAWVICRDAGFPAFLNILVNNYENHPSLQHWVLLPFAKLGFPYAFQAALNWLFSVSAVFLFLRNAPLPRLAKVAFIFSFYMVFEYSVISRPYILAILMMFVVATVYPSRFKNPFGYGGAVFLLFNAEYVVFGLAWALTLIYGLEWLSRRSDRKVLGAWVLMLVGGFWVFKQGVLVPKDHYDYGVVTFQGAQNFMMAMQKAIFPFAPWRFSGNEEFLVPMIAAAIFVGGLFAVARSPAGFSALFLTLVQFFFLFTFKRPGDLRHFGFLLLTLLFSLWVAAADARSPSPRALWKLGAGFPDRKIRKGVLVLLSACLLTMLQYTPSVYRLEYAKVFSGAKQMAAILKAIEKELGLFSGRGFVIATRDPASSGVSAYLPGVRTWNGCMEQDISYYPATRRLRDCSKLSHGEFFRRAQARFGDLSRALFLLKEPLPFHEANGYRFIKIARTDPKPFGYTYEVFHLYRVEKIAGQRLSGG